MPYSSLQFLIVLHLNWDALKMFENTILLSYEIFIVLCCL